MRFENWRGMPLAIALAAAIGLGLGWSSTTRADGYHLHPTIPPTVAAYNYTTGGEFKAPPVPYGHYAKNHVYDPRYLASCASCRLHALLGGGGFGHGTGCGLCGGKGCGHCSGAGLFGHDGAGSACAGPGCDGGSGFGHHAAAGRFAPIDCGSVAVPVVAATSQSSPVGTAVVQPSSQYPCGQSGCGISTRHSHGKGKHASLCGGCHGRGCGFCEGAGTVGGCGEPGCGLCKGIGFGKGCGFCGGKGCSHCLSGLHGKLSSLTGRFHHQQKVDYFMGAGGPVPLTPGYVPYVNVTRSPRGFFAFPPMNPFDP
jgi:hypothetical protein